MIKKQKTLRANQGYVIRGTKIDSFFMTANSMIGNEISSMTQNVFTHHPHPRLPAFAFSSDLSGRLAWSLRISRVEDERMNPLGSNRSFQLWIHKKNLLDATVSSNIVKTNAVIFFQETKRRWEIVALCNSLLRMMDKRTHPVSILRAHNASNIQVCKLSRVKCTNGSV